MIIQLLIKDFFPHCGLLQLNYFNFIAVLWGCILWNRYLLRLGITQVSSPKPENVKICLMVSAGNFHLRKINQPTNQIYQEFLIEKSYFLKMSWSKKQWPQKSSLSPQKQNQLRHAQFWHFKFWKYSLVQCYIYSLNFLLSYLKDQNIYFYWQNFIIFSDHQHSKKKKVTNLYLQSHGENQGGRF